MKFLENAPDKPYLIGGDDAMKAAVFVPFAEIDGTEYVLFEKRASGIRQEGEICFPGGAYDAVRDRSFLETAIRETVEELGIKADLISADIHLGYLVANIGASVEIFAGRIKISGKSDLNINRNEVESIHFVPLSFFLENTPDKYKLQIEIKSLSENEEGEKTILFPARQLGLPEKYHNSWRGRNPDIYVYKYDDIVIWGLTANIIREISEIIKEDKK